MNLIGTHIIYEDADFRITLRNTGCDILIVAFSPMDWPEREKSDRYWGCSVACKLPFSWLSIDAMKAHWFCYNKWQKISFIINEVVQGFDVRIGYGHSMGAYAALKYSGDYLPDAIMAFAPQCSINPADVGGFDLRYQRYFDLNLHGNMLLRNSDILCGRAFVFFDAKFSPDREHVQKIAGPNVECISVDYMRHDVIYAASGSVKLCYLIFRGLLNEHAGAREMSRYLRVQKKSNLLYYSNLAYWTLKKGHARLALDITSKALKIWKGNTRIMLLKLQASACLNLKFDALEVVKDLDFRELSGGDVLVVARALADIGENTEAVRVMDRSIITESENPKYLRAFAERLISAGEIGRAVKILERTLLFAPNDPHVLAHLAKALMRDRDAAEYDPFRAAKLLQSAIEMLPSVANFWKSYAFTLEAVGDLKGALLAWEQVESLTEIEAADRARLERLRINSKLFHHQ